MKLKFENVRVFSTVKVSQIARLSRVYIYELRYELDGIGGHHFWEGIKNDRLYQI